MAVQLLLCGVLPPGLVQYCSQHSCVIAVKLFLHTFSKRLYIYIAVSTRPLLGKKLHFILSVRSNFDMSDCLSIAIYTFACRVLMSVSVDETLLPK